MAAVVKVQQAPVMTVWLIVKCCEGGIVKQEAWSAVVSLNRDSQDGVHGHVQDTSMGSHQGPPRPAVENVMDGPPCPQVHFPAAFPGFPITRIRGDEIRPWRYQRSLGLCQPGQNPIVDLHPVGIQLQWNSKRLADDLRRLAGAQQRAGNAAIKSHAVCLPAFGQRLRLGASFCGQWKMKMPRETLFDI